MTFHPSLALISLILAFVLVPVLGSGVAFSKNYTHESLFILDPLKTHLPLFQKSGDFTIDHETARGYELYGPPGTREWVSSLEVPWTDLPDEAFSFLAGADLADYPSPEEVEKTLLKLQQDYPHLVRVFSLGRSRENRELWMVKVSDFPLVDEVEPEVKYIANMHGNEIMGRELMVLLLRDLVEGYERGDEAIRQLVNNTEIFIMPSMNPDGMSKRQRGNADYVDLNRDFPYLPGLSAQKEGTLALEPETQSIINFHRNRHFALSANFHGGAVVVNYPWDSKGQRHPQDSLVQALSLEYASRVKSMRESGEFPRGITNGHDWYQVLGGMQDWSEFFHGDLQFTMEVSLNKWPAYAEVSKFFQEHRAALYRFLFLVHQGAGLRGEGKNGFLQGSVQIHRVTGPGPGRSLLGNYPINGGEFYKVLEPGQYEWVVTLPENRSRTLRVDIPSVLSVEPNGRFYSP